MKIQYAQEELGNGLVLELGASNLCLQQPWEAQLSCLWLFLIKPTPVSPRGWEGGTGSGAMPRHWLRQQDGDAIAGAWPVPPRGARADQRFAELV